MAGRPTRRRAGTPSPHLWETAPHKKRAGSNSSPAAYYRWRDNTSLFTAVGAWGWDKVTLTGGPWPERVQVQRVAGDYLQALEVQPALGRGFQPEDERSTDCPMLVSAHLRRNSFGSDTGIVAARDEVE